MNKTAYRATVLAVLSILTVAVPSLGNRGNAQVARTSPADALLGEWWTENNEGRIRFTRYKDGTYRGTTTCCTPAKSSEDDSHDIHNPNPKQRNRSTIGIIIIWDLAYDEDGEFSGGHVYNPRNGKTYGFEVKVIDPNTVKIRGYLGIPLLGQTQIWKRAQPASASHRAGR